jgi:hypothetical protein
MTWFVCLGLALGLGYYAKAVLFPVGLLFMVVAVFAAGSLRKAFLPAIVMVLVFFSITAPLVAAISKSVGRLTIGESGRVDYAWFVFGQPSAFYLSPPIDYRKDPPNVIHPDIAFFGDDLPVVRMLRRGPDVLQFAPQGNATYPPWSNPNLFASGLKATFNFGDQTRTISKNLEQCLPILIWPIPLTWAAYFVLLFSSAQSPGRWRCIRRVWPLFIIGTGGLSIYILILLESRYIAAFVALLGISLLCSVQYQRPKGGTRRTAAATWILISSLAATSVGIVIYHAARPPKPLQGAICEASSVASALSKDGVRPGDVIAVIGDGESSMAVARFARVRIDVEIPFREATKFWQISDPRERNAIYQALNEGGARVAVSDDVPAGMAFPEWRRIEDTDFYVHTLEQNAQQ